MVAECWGIEPLTVTKCKLIDRQLQYSFGCSIIPSPANVGCLLIG